MSDIDPNEDGEGHYAVPVFETLEKDLDEKYPNRPHNHSETLPFHSLFQDLFNPLNENKKKATGPALNRRKLGPKSGVQSTNPQEVRRAIIERFISRWRQQVGDDIYPAFRLIIPEKDRERAMYGLKEKALGKNLVKIMKIDKNSEDGYALLNWKLPGQNAESRMAGDFAGRCFEVIKKRPFLVEVGDMTVGQVNGLLDKLAAAQKEENQLPILEEFYTRMNAEELMWLIRIILRQMKVGATEKTFFNLWHPDAESLFNASSSLRRVCWELHNPQLRLEGEERGVALMQCFQPQLAQFQMHSFPKMVEKMRPTEDDPEFWIEEKLDGERMQLHMITDETIPGGKRFAFWSRKAKEYTYLYGDGFHDPNGSLTRQLKFAFRDGVENIILDGEMISWDPEEDAAIPFGHLKTAALAENRNPFAKKEHPFFKVFDILYLNHQPLTNYTLRDRRKALDRSVKPIERRLEIHTYTVGIKADDIEPLLRHVIATGEEGLVLKNPRSAYHLNDRNYDWLKVKPDYLQEFGESLDCLVIGGYYGSGHRGGALSSFLCGLRVDETSAKNNEVKPQKFYSFFRVGGGLTANDYAKIRHATEGKWHMWDRKNPPTEYIELGGGDLQYERPDVWIKPEDSVVVEAKAATVGASDQYRCGLTLRFPRFKRLRTDKNWQTALSTQEFYELKENVDHKRDAAELKVDDGRRKRRKVNIKPVTVAGYTRKSINEAKFEGPSSNVFAGLTFYIMTESIKPEKQTKIALEKMVKANGGKVVQEATRPEKRWKIKSELDDVLHGEPGQEAKAVEKVVCIAERKTVKVASLQKSGDVDIVRPIWLFDCLKQNRTDVAKGILGSTVPLELERHFYYIVPEHQPQFEDNVDEYGDSYARNTSMDELRELMKNMAPVRRRDGKDITGLAQNFGELAGRMFFGTTIFFDPGQPKSVEENGTAADTSTPDAGLSIRMKAAWTTARFAKAAITRQIEDTAITHVVVHEKSNLKQIRLLMSSRATIPRIVTPSWIEDSWNERTRLDEERFAPRWQ